jgi:histidinol-phosphate aminotransferase
VSDRFEPLRHVKPAVRRIGAYTLKRAEARVKVNQNENPYELPEALKRRLLESALTKPWSRYPDFEPTELVEALARFAGWTPAGVMVGNGSNELIESLLMVTVRPGTRVAVPQPTFSLYGLLTSVLSGRVLPVSLDSELEYEPIEMRRLRRELAVPVTIICSPNNPTGCVFPLEGLAAMCEESDGLVVVDEAYHEFSGQTAVPLLSRHPNLVILRTFSKAMALAGLRVGYLLAAPELVREINKARLPYNLNFFSQQAALATLEEWDSVRLAVDRLIESREELLYKLYRVPGVRPFPSRANFILFELLEADPKAVFESTLRRGVLVRDVTSYPRLSRCLRVSVGTEEENRAFLLALRHAVEEARFARR